MYIVLCNVPPSRSIMKIGAILSFSWNFKLLILQEIICHVSQRTTICFGFQDLLLLLHADYIFPGVVKPLIFDWIQVKQIGLVFLVLDSQ